MIWLRRLLRLVLHTAPTVFLVVTLGFLLMQLAPGDVVDFIAAESGAADAEAMASFRHVLGLDQGVLAQLVAYYQELLSGSLGTSLRYGKPVTALIASPLRKVGAQHCPARATHTRPGARFYDGQSGLQPLWDKRKQLSNP